MKSEKNQGGLLIRLQELAGCQYLSDLHNSFYIEDVLYALRKINIASYSMDEWREAFRYILGKDPECSSKDEIVSTLIRDMRTCTRQNIVSD